MLRKAFLCHSSIDKPFVEAVMRRLGRARVIFDAISFAPGQDFRTAIRKGLDETSIFVFFVSCSSIESTWCRFELDQAELRLISGEIDGHLAIIIDTAVAAKDLPTWMSTVRAVWQTRAGLAARDIEEALILATSGREGEAPFVGRGADMERFAAGLVPQHRAIPHLIVVSGLEGVGRTTFLRRAVKDNLRLMLGPFIFVGHTWGLEDVHQALREELEGESTFDDVESDLTVFRGLDLPTKIKELKEQLYDLGRERAMPCFVDRGGMLADDGTYRPEFDELFAGFLEGRRDDYIAVIHRRRPALDLSRYSSRTLMLRLSPLEDRDMQLLLSGLLAGRMKPNDDTVVEIVRYLDGYPPAAYFARGLIQQYGPEYLRLDKTRLSAYKAHQFVPFLETVALTELDWFTLRYLAGEQAPLPIVALATALDESTEVMAATVAKLVDYSLLIIRHDAYSISPPISEPVTKIKGVLPAETYSDIAARLVAGFWRDNGKVPSLAVIDATLHARLMSSRSPGNGAAAKISRLVRPSALHTAAEDFYHRGEYQCAIDYASRALGLGGRKSLLREIIYKALVQQKRYEEAGKVLAEVKLCRDKRYNFLAGFGLRKQGKFAAAIDYLRAALRHGDSSVSTRRELAFCLDQRGRYDEALEQCTEALATRPDNLFLLDLVVSIQISRGDFVAAGQALRALEDADVTEEFSLHRRAALLAAKARWTAALEFVERACARPHARPEAHFQRADILIEMERFDDAQRKLGEIEHRFHHADSDTLTGLRCKLFARMHNWPEAEESWYRLEDKSRPAHRALWRLVMIAKSEDTNLSLTERRAAAEEVSREVSPASMPVVGFSPAPDD